MILKYQTDVTDTQWNILKPIVDIPNSFGRPRQVQMRDIINALNYQAKTGCQWAMLPNDFPPKSTVFYYFSKFKQDGTFIEINRITTEISRKQHDRDIEPTAAVIDSQNVSSINVCEDVGYDGAKKIKGRKRHIAVDVKGHLLACKVHSASIPERDGAKLLLPILAAWFMNILIIFADGGYSGEPIKQWAMAMFYWIFKVIKRPRKRFQIVKFRWVVERTFAWLLTYRRLSRSYERYSDSEEAWIYFISGMMNLKRVA
ncbi:IS5 family transposase [Thiotrichales bacterium 19X7-9]|nr:IS5 family transposase [Thiotrichales bacterium 19X7-9]